MGMVYGNDRSSEILSRVRFDGVNVHRVLIYIILYYPLTRSIVCLYHFPAH